MAGVGAPAYSGGSRSSSPPRLHRALVRPEPSHAPRPPGRQVGAESDSLLSESAEDLPILEPGSTELETGAFVGVIHGPSARERTDDLRHPPGRDRGVACPGREVRCRQEEIRSFSGAFRAQRIDPARRSV